jgi:hypothetical protein
VIELTAHVQSQAAECRPEAAGGSRNGASETGHGAGGTLRRASGLGFGRPVCRQGRRFALHLTKPFDFTELLQAIATLEIS